MMSLGRVELGDEYAAIAVTGEDTIKLLQSLVTCDMQALDAARSLIGSFPNPKGRVIILFRAIAIDDGCALVVPRTMAERTRSHLQLYKFRAKVAFRSLDDTHSLVGVMGAEARGWIAARFEVAPDEAGGSVEANGVRVIRVHGAAPRFLLFGERTLIDAALQELPLVEDGWEMWSRAEIEAGVPQIVPAISEAFLPQNLNLEALGGLSFTKGCYPGQEVIARTQHLGTVKRRLMRGVSESSALVPGTALKSVHNGAEQDAGRVIASVGGRVLAVVPLEMFESNASFYTDDTPPIAVKSWERL